jgi:hypothetical protein
VLVPGELQALQKSSQQDVRRLSGVVGVVKQRRHAPEVELGLESGCDHIFGDYVMRVEKPWIVVKKIGKLDVFVWV